MATLPLPLFLVDEANHVQFANEAAQAFFSRSARRLVGRQISELFDFESERLNKAFLGFESYISAQNMQLIKPIGPTTHIDVNISSIVGYPEWRLMLFTPRQGDRDQIGEQSGGKQQAMGAPAILGHEIKNPLAGIKGAAQLLAKKIDPSQTPLTDLIVTEVDRIARLLDQMQNLGRVVPGEMVAENIHAIIERAVRSIRAANADIPMININYDPSLPMVKIEPDAMVQVLINLIQNAIDALRGQSEPVIGITTRFIMGAPMHGGDGKDVKATRLPVEIMISDNGPGIAPHIENELFSPFVTTKREGQGLGLAIVRKYLSQMSSRIVVERDNSVGLTHFRIFLPVAE